MIAAHVRTNLRGRFATGTGLGRVLGGRRVTVRLPRRPGGPFRLAGPGAVSLGTATAVRDSAVAIGIVLGLPDQIFATLTQYAFLAAVAVAGTAATAGAAVLQHRRP